MYQFKLEALLEHRKRVEENLQREFAQAVRQVDEEKARLGELHQDRARCQAQLAQRQAALRNVSEIPLYFGYLNVLDGLIARQQEKVALSQRHQELRRKELLGGMKKRKILDKLKEKGAADYQRAMERQERAFADEVAISRHVRQ